MADIRGRSISERLRCKAVDPVAGNFHFGDQLSCCCVGHAFRIFVTISDPGNKESFCEFGKRLYGPEEADPSLDAAQKDLDNVTQRLKDLRADKKENDAAKKEVNKQITDKTATAEEIMNQIADAAGVLDSKQRKAEEAKKTEEAKKAEEAKAVTEVKNTSDKKEIPDVSGNNTDTVKTGDPAQARMFMSTAMVGLAGIVAGLKGKFRKKED